MTRPAIIIVAFNRPQSLKRLLSSIDRSTYPNGEVPLCICIDYQDSDANRAVVRMAEDYVWNFGPKEVIHQTENLGLKAHVLTCGDLTERFGSIIMLEDDLFVSPAFYGYAKQALDYYAEENKVGGISLYNHQMNFSSQAPFGPVEDGSDIYFLQIASSWGQAWNKFQWRLFKKWLLENPEINRDSLIPNYIINWPEKSWLKYYISYLTQSDKYFVYPRISLTTNFGDTGENNAKASFFFQVPFLLEEKEFVMKNFDASQAKYDAYFDLLPSVISSQNSDLRGYDFISNISGLKEISKFNKEWVLEYGFNEKAEKSYGLHFKPAEVNVLFNIGGKDISLVRVLDSKAGSLTVGDRKRLFDYDRGIITIQEKVLNVVDTVLNRFLG